MEKPVDTHVSKMQYDTDGLARRAAYGWLKYNKDNYSYEDYSVSTIETDTQPPPTQPKLF